MDQKKKQLKNLSPAATAFLRHKPAHLSVTKKRSRDWERDQRTDPEFCQISYRHIRRSVRDRIKVRAQNLGTDAGRLANLLLEYGLSEMDNGNLEIVDEQ